MDKKKKSTCGCLSFLRKKKTSSVQKAEDSQKNQSIPFVQERILPGEVQVNRSSSSYPRHSTIVPPLSQRPSFYPSSHPDSAGCFSFTRETSVSRPTYKELPIISAVPLEVQEKSEKIDKIEEISNFQLDIKENAGKEGNHEGLNEKNPHFFASSGPSPEWLVGTSKFASPALASIGLSPVRMDDNYEDFADVVYLMKTSACHQRVPDIFGQNCIRPRFLPVIKPTTPAFFAKRRPCPIFKQEKNL
jgi:hypothetical protein